MKSVPSLPKRLTHIVLDTAERIQLSDVSLIVPVPLSRRRLHERGFNQADVIAKVVATATGVRLDGKSLERTKHSPIHRVGMDRKARDLSVQGSFSVVRPKLVEGQGILLVDDVYTTGATVSHCAKALLKAGAEDVRVLTVARATRVPFGPD